MGVDKEVRVDGVCEMSDEIHQQLKIQAFSTTICAVGFEQGLKA